jgi:hypothetical protein
MLTDLAWALTPAATLRKVSSPQPALDGALTDAQAQSNGLTGRALGTQGQHGFVAGEPSGPLLGQLG